IGMGLKVRDGLERAHCRNVEDGASSLLQHMRDCRSNEPERTLHEQIKGLVPYLVWCFVEWSGIEQVTGIVHEDVKTATCSDRGFHRFPDIRIIRDAALKRQCMAAVLLNGSDDPLQFLLPPTRDRDRGAFPRKDFGNCLSNTGSSARHNGHFLFESHGAPSLEIIELSLS